MYLITTLAEIGESVSLHTSWHGQGRRSQGTNETFDAIWFILMAYDTPIFSKETPSMTRVCSLCWLVISYLSFVYLSKCQINIFLLHS